MDSVRLDPENVKALYRRAESRIRQDENLNKNWQKKPVCQKSGAFKSCPDLAGLSKLRPTTMIWLSRTDGSPGFVVCIEMVPLGGFSPCQPPGSLQSDGGTPPCKAVMSNISRLIATAKPGKNNFGGLEEDDLLDHPSKTELPAFGLLIQKGQQNKWNPGEASRRTPCATGEGQTLRS